ncbi:hypothetical protein BpHYR1_018828 [Brachionus plicatilis]|uniref:Uncharacterized protein n=1 Tax=Brachionus plicatilis TaxID=10195 RepID=A0A3M7QR24_BRAPC|nr:hypothetical protein BpHYR1_018828 [Brachionus plicatilis]
MRDGIRNTLFKLPRYNGVIGVKAESSFNVTPVRSFVRCRRMQLPLYKNSNGQLTTKEYQCYQRDNYKEYECLDDLILVSITWFEFMDFFVLKFLIACKWFTPKSVMNEFEFLTFNSSLLVHLQS